MFHPWHSLGMTVFSCIPKKKPCALLNNSTGCCNFPGYPLNCHDAPKVMTATIRSQSCLDFKNLDGLSITSYSNKLLLLELCVLMLAPDEEYLEEILRVKLSGCCFSEDEVAERCFNMTSRGTYLAWDKNSIALIIVMGEVMAFGTTIIGFCGAVADEFLILSALFFPEERCCCCSLAVSRLDFVNISNTPDKSLPGARKIEKESPTGISMETIFAVFCKSFPNSPSSVTIKVLSDNILRNFCF
mmetsp:Transcript_19648/g.28044  ORF Transcript_19648/g.28044 Transcript_19648/m.28044 type:complete len:244 (-) Transcript_19648:802-1533(-)